MNFLSPLPRAVAGRLAYIAVVVLAVYTLAFVLLYALPSDPVALMLDRRSSGAGGNTPEQLAALRLRYGVDEPMAVRYFAMLGQLLRGDLGVSFQSGKPVAELLAAVAPNTLALAGSALVLALPFSFTIGLLASWRRDGVLHRLLSNLPGFVAAIPAFWLGLLLLQIFAFQLRWAPSAGGQGLPGLVLPAIALALPVSAALMAVLIRSLDSIQDAPFITLLRGRGLPWRSIYLGHVLRNALLPFLTLSGLTLGGVLVGTVVTETVFSRAGLGRLLVSSIETQDAPVVLALALLAAIAFATINLLVDLLYPLLDPRLRGYAGAAPS